MKNTVSVIDEREVLGKDFRIYGTPDNLLFLAKDVAEWIDYAKTGKGTYDVSKMLEVIDEDEKLVRTIFVSGQNREMWFLTEDGLYEVLMQSKKPIAKEFKKQVKEILKTIRKNGMYAIDELLDNPDMLLKTVIKLKEEREARLLAESIVEEQQRQLHLKDKEIEVKEDIIIGLVDNVSLADKRQILNRVITHKGANYKERWTELYKQFELKYHINLNARMKKYKASNRKPRISSKLDYIDMVMNKLPELYEIACKLYETDIKEIINELYGLN